MMKSVHEKTIKLINNDNDSVDVMRIVASDDGKNVKIVCKKGPLKEKIYTGLDYFWLLGELRDDLFKLGLRPLIKGAVNDVFPGGMMGQTSLGLIAYIIDENGAGAGKVNIFDEAKFGEAHKISSFSEHKAYRKALAIKRRSRKL